MKRLDWSSCKDSKSIVMAVLKGIVEYAQLNTVGVTSVCDELILCRRYRSVGYQQGIPQLHK